MAKDATTTEVVPWEESDLEGIAAIEPTSALVAQAYAAVTDKTLPPEIGDPAISARLILERIKTGTFEESMTPAQGLPNWSDRYLDQTVVVYGFHMNKSTYEIQDGEHAGKKGVYAVVELAKAGSGELETVITGGQNVLMQLIKAWEERKYPFQAVMTSKKTGSGNTTLWLQKPES